MSETKEVKPYERKCKNWLQTFGEWTLPRSEAPETFIFWTGLFTLASVLKRKVFISKDYLGSWEVSPNLYILFIAPAGKARKSTTVNYTEDLLGNIPAVTMAPEIVTKESLMEKLVKGNNDASMCITSPEFGEFIVKSGTTMFGFLTNLFDGKKQITGSTITRGNEFASRPCVNLLGATTPEWVAENMPESVIGGGFASRVIFIFEDKVRRRKLFYRDTDKALMQQLHRDLLSDLAHISDNINGEFMLSDEAEAFMNDWYNRTAEDGDTVSYKMHGYYERRPAHVFKVAIILHCAYSDTLILEKNDFEQAINLLLILEDKLPKVFQNIGNNPHTVDIYRILEYIQTKRVVKKEEVVKHFMSAATPSMLSELIDGLYAAGDITIKVDKDSEGRDFIWLIASLDPALALLQEIKNQVASE